MDINSDQFLTSLRSALHYLYDPDRLRRSPLVLLFGLAGRVDAALALKTILVEAIEALRPGDQEPPQTREWLVYEVLFFRYVRGYAREAVANQLGMSDRQLSREQRTAIETLAMRLWRTYPLQTRPQPPPILPAAADAANSDLGLAESAGGAWVDNLPADKSTPWKSTLRSVLDLMHPLIVQNGTCVRVEPTDELPDLLAPQTTLRHALINLLGLVLPIAGQGRLTLTPSVSDQCLSIQVEVLPASAGGEGVSCLPALAGHPNVAVARTLLERSGGSLSIEAGDLGAGAPRAQLQITVPALAQSVVLVVDDNPDTIQLFQRYAQGTRYTIAGLQSPLEVVKEIERIHPHILLIDLMMPDRDGWELLFQVRQNDSLPILVCSILPQADLSRALGADGFLQKPVLPQDFLNALDRLIDPPTPG